jgi:hypothetical protein
MPVKIRNAGTDTTLTDRITLTLQNAEASEVGKGALQLFDRARPSDIGLGGTGLSLLLDACHI